MIVTMILMTVTTILASSKIILNTNSAYLSRYFPYVSPPFDTGSSQNVLILAKGEPLTAFGQHP